MPAYAFQEQIGNEGAPNLDFDGVLVVSKKISQRIVLLDALEKRFYLPAMPVNLRYCQWGKFEIVGKESFLFWICNPEPDTIGF